MMIKLIAKASFNGGDSPGDYAITGRIDSP